MKACVALVCFVFLLLPGVRYVLHATRFARTFWSLALRVFFLFKLFQCVTDCSYYPSQTLFKTTAMVWPFPRWAAEGNVFIPTLLNQLDAPRRTKRSFPFPFSACCRLPAWAGGKIGTKPWSDFPCCCFGCVGSIPVPVSLLESKKKHTHHVTSTTGQINIELGSVLFASLWKW